jgi:anthranilate/para-aminobenzoate synthase component I
VLRQRELAVKAGPLQLQRSLLRQSALALTLDGRGFEDAWLSGPLVALDPTLRCLARSAREVDDKLDALEAYLAARRSVGGTAETGVALLLAYDLWQSGPEGGVTLPRMLALGVDRSLRYTAAGRALLTMREPADCAAYEAGLEARLDRPAGEEEPPSAAQAAGWPVTSLPRERYLRAVTALKEQIRAGNIYQGNLTQRLEVAYRGDPYELFADLTRKLPAPHSAFLQAPGVTLASLSPETFLRVDRAGRIETRPIKGTRPRGSTPREDQAAADELLGSSKDRAELLMIVDLERNDLSRLCRAGSVEVRELARLRSYPSVHHLVARIRGRLRPGVGLRAILDATFPGGSITGAPKLRAMEILAALEPVSRNFFTGSLLWLGDDGSWDSSILIRTLVFDGGRVFLGAGGGVVADSEPFAEWEESNHKVRGLAHALGFDPREARAKA